jgi:glycosyltransferase involved in cell wall biosynthesis
MKDSRIAVVIPTYNAERFVCDALNSVAGQKRRPEQIIVSDDGSDDQTRNRVREWARGYNIEVLVLENSHRGVSAARNHGIRLAGTDLIAFLDADDVFLPSHLLQLEQAFHNHSGLTLCFGDAEYLESQGVSEGTDQIGSRIESVPYETQPDGLRIMQGSAYSSLLRGNYISLSASLLSKAALERVGFFDERLRNSEDRDLFLRLSRFGLFAYYPFIVTQKLRHEGNLTHPRNAVSSQRSQFMVLYKMLDHAAQMGLSGTELLQTRIALIEHSQMMVRTASLQGFAAWHQTCGFLLRQKTVAPVFNLRHCLRALVAPILGRAKTSGASS